MNAIIEPTKEKGGLYLGNLNAATNLANLNNKKIQAVLTLTESIEVKYNKKEIEYHKYIRIEDWYEV